MVANYFIDVHGIGCEAYVHSNRNQIGQGETIHSAWQSIPGFTHIQKHHANCRWGDKLGYWKCRWHEFQCGIWGGDRTSKNRLFTYIEQVLQ